MSALTKTEKLALQQGARHPKGKFVAIKSATVTNLIAIGLARRPLPNEFDETPSLCTGVITPEGRKAILP